MKKTLIMLSLALALAACNSEAPAPTPAAEPAAAASPAAPATPAAPVDMWTRYDEIAALCHTTHAAVRSRIFRARLALRDALAPPPPLGPTLIRRTTHDD